MQGQNARTQECGVTLFCAQSQQAGTQQRGGLLFHQNNGDSRQVGEISLVFR